MANCYPFPKSMELPIALGEMILLAAESMAAHSKKAFRIARRRGRGRSLRPGKDTPLWNELRSQLRPFLRKYGDQVTLGRVLDLPRQRINAYVTAGTQMPDAERTLQLLAWLIAAQQRRRPV